MFNERSWKRPGAGAAVALLLALLLAGCRAKPAADPQAAIHLLDGFRPEMVKQASSAAASIPRTEWSFGAPVPAAARPGAETLGWEAGPGVASLRVEGGALVGESTTAFPVLHLARVPPAQSDSLHSIEITMRASAGGNLAVQFVPMEVIDLAGVPARAQVMPWRLSTPLVRDGEMRTYSLSPQAAVDSSATRHILIRPTDEAGARFEIRSVRLIFRREHLASIPAGVSWQGLGEVYHEALVTRTPEVVSLPVEVPSDAVLHLAVGTTESAPVTFRVAARRGDDAETLLESTVTTSDRWEPVSVDLSSFAGDEIDLELSLASGRDGMVGLWGSPTVRSRRAESGRRAGGSGPPRGVILIVADTLRSDHLDAYGYGRDTAPFLQELAGEGALFADCQAQATWTKSAVPSILTSLYPSSHRVLEFADRLPASAETIAEVYRKAGYATLSLSSVFFTGRVTNLHQGFDELHESTSLATQGSSKTAREYVDRLLPWLEEHQDSPFFVFLHLYDPHFPYEPYAPYDSLWANPARKAEHEAQVAAVRPVIGDPLLRMIGMPSRSELSTAGVAPDAFAQQNIDWYDGSIRGLDAEVRRLVGKLRSLGLDRDTVVALVSDHGEEFLDHDRMFHGQSVYGELTNVPLLLWAPGRLPAGLRVASTVQTLDVMPTLIDLSGLEQPQGVQGRSLVPLLEAKDGSAPPKGWRELPAFSEKPAARDALSPPPRETQSTAVVFEGWKLIHNEARPAGAPEYELYDHRKDPLDRRNVASENPQVVERLARLIDGWRRKVRAERLKSDQETRETLSSEELERLRSLGYIQ